MTPTKVLVGQVLVVFAIAHRTLRRGLLAGAEKG